MTGHSDMNRTVRTSSLRSLLLCLAMTGLIAGCGGGGGGGGGSGGGGNDGGHPPPVTQPEDPPVQEPGDLKPNYVPQVPTADPEIGAPPQAPATSPN